MAAKRRSRFQPLLFALCLLALTYPVLQFEFRERPEIVKPVLFGGSESEAITKAPTLALVAYLGGFRYIAADLLWLKADEVWESGEWGLMVPYLEGTVALNPQFILAWRVLGWHQAWNLNVAETSEIRKQQRIEEGEKSFKRAIAANPTNWELHWELAWLYYDRAKEYHKSIPAIEATAKLKDAPSYVSRFKYRVYEKTLEIPELKAALEENMKLFPKEVLHQQKVRQDYDYWFRGWKQRVIKNGQWVEVQRPPAAYDPVEHKRNIEKTNASRMNMGFPALLYKDNPYWDVDPKTGKAVPKGRVAKG